MFHIYPAFTTIFHAHSLDKQFVIKRYVSAVESRELEIAMFRRVYLLLVVVVACAGASLLPGHRGDIPDGPQGPPGALLKVLPFTVHL